MFSFGLFCSSCFHQLSTSSWALAAMTTNGVSGLKSIFCHVYGRKRLKVCQKVAPQFPHIFFFLCLSTPAGAQAADDTPPLRPILCLALCFALAQFHVSQLLLNSPLPCVLWSSSVSTTLRGPSQSFFRYTSASFPHCVPNPSPLPTSNCCLHGILLSHVPQFFIGYLVFPVTLSSGSSIITHCCCLCQVSRLAESLHVFHL